MNKIYTYLLAASLLFILIGCQKETTLPSGSIVEKIEQSQIHAQAGASMMLDLGEETKTFYLIRHAEKDTFPKNNPVLNDAGYTRAYRLADIFRQTRLDKVYSTLYNRTMHTVDSLVQTKGIATSIYMPKDMKTLSEDMLASDTDNKVLIVGHSNTIPGMVNLLMGKKVIDKSIDEDTYDQFFIVDIPKDQKPVLYQFRY